MSDTRHKVLLIDCMNTARPILTAALNHAGFDTRCADSDGGSLNPENEDYLVFCLQHENQSRILPYLAFGTLKKQKKLVIVDPNDTDIVSLVRHIGWVGILHKPIQMRALIEKMKTLPDPELIPETSCNCQWMPFERDFIEKHLEESHAEVIWADTQILPDEFLSESFLQDEEKRDLERDKKLFEVSVDESEILDSWFDSSENLCSVFKSNPENNEPVDEVDDAEVDDDDVEDEDVDDDEEADDENNHLLSWGIEQYQKNHSEELSPDEWKAKTLERLRNEKKSKVHRTNRKLLVVIAMLMAVILVVILIKFG